MRLFGDLDELHVATAVKKDRGHPKGCPRKGIHKPLRSLASSPSAPQGLCFFRPTFPAGYLQKSISYSGKA
jgi:hypothetical protein